MRIKRILCAAVAAAMMQGAAIDAAGTDTVTRRYSFDAEESGITYYGAYEFGTGQTGNALSLTGGYARLDAYPLGESFTVAAWVKPDALANWERLFDFGTDTNNYIFFTFNNGSGAPRLAVKTGGGKEQNVTADASLANGVWSHVAVTMSGTTASIYIDGAQAGTGTITASVTPLANSANNYIGKSQYAADANYSGAIDELEIYDSALTAGEIAERMRATAAEVEGFAAVTAEIDTGETPSLPPYVEVTYKNGMSAKTAVDWGTLNPIMTQGEHEIVGKTTIAGTAYDVTAKVTAVSESLDESYSVTRSMNFVQNTGTSFVEAIYDVYSDKTDELELRLTAGERSETVAFTPNGTVSAKLHLEPGEYTVSSQITNKATGAAVTAERTRRITVGANYADAAEIRLETGSTFGASAETGLAYVKSIDVDRLLAPSYEMHGLTPPNNAARYGGWERRGANNWTSSGGADTYTLAGHSLGHWMSAAAVLWRETGDAEVLEMLNYAVDKLDELQTGTGSAYIGGVPETTFAKCFNGDTKWADGYWVPWYGIHKIYQGLLDAYDCTENTKAFTVLKKFSDWAVDGTSALSDAQLQSVLNVEYGGMNEIFARMYEITGDEDYLSAAVRFTHDSVIDPLISGRDSLTGLHANTQIPKIVGAAEIYEQSPETYASYRTAAENFWHFVNDNRGYAIGGNSIAEHFEAEGAETLGIKTCESCNTYNMMRLTEHLFAWEHDSAYMDWYEKALYNHILGQQEPETGAKMYFVSLLQGHHRVYEVKDESWWCCTGTGMENPGRYTRTAYYEDGDTLYVNLYMAGTYNWPSKGLSFEVETDYPYSDRVNIKVTGGHAAAELKFRAPGWLKSDMTAAAHGETTAAAGGGWLTVSGEWSEGDVIELTLPMDISVYESRTAGRIVYEYGPVVLAADLGAVEGVTGVDEYISNETRIDSVTADVPYIVSGGADPASMVTEKDRSALTFTIAGEYMSDGNDMTLKPFYEIHHSFHNVYWNVDQGADLYEKWLNDITVDKVEPDGQQDEIGHELVSYSSNQGSFTGGEATYFYRDAFGSADAYFQYAMEIDGAAQNYLFVRYWGGDVPFSRNGVTYTRDFSIYVDGQLLAEQSINNDKPGSPYDVFYKLPREYTDGKSSITVKFAPKSAASCAGGMLQMRVTSTDTQAAALRETVTVTAEDGAVKFTSSYGSGIGCDMYIAVYSADGGLAAVKMNESEGEIALPAGEYRVKAFFWNGAAPVSESKVFDVTI